MSEEIVLSELSLEDLYELMKEDLYDGLAEEMVSTVRMPNEWLPPPPPPEPPTR